MSEVRSRGLLALACLVVATLVVPTTLSAQTEAEREIERRLGRMVTPEEIMRGLADSGLSREQVRARLQQRGLDPTLADPYFDRLQSQGTGGLPVVQSEFVEALVELGLIAPDSTAFRRGLFGDSLGLDTLRIHRPDSIARGDSLVVFGKAVFSRARDQFAPVLTGPVPPNYRLGPGDELTLVLTGDVELAYTLPVSREGTIIIPDVGQISVNGLTVGQLENRLYERLGRAYSGVARGPDATTNFQLTLGRLRVNQVYVIGEVELPGPHEVSAVGTVLSALYRAAGPTLNGSFRAVQVRRGGEVVAVVDLYDYLLTGDTEGDVRLEQGDVVFVPIAGAQVRVMGEVERPAIYELVPGEGLVNAVAFAGGPTAEADLERVRVDRILPFGQRTAQRERVLEVVDLMAAVVDEGVQPLADGDRVRVPPIGAEQRDLVRLAGSVYRVGEFELVPGMTLWDLIGRAGGLRPEAFEAVAHVRRLNEADSTYNLLRVSLRRTPEGNPVDDLVLADQDSVVVFGRPLLNTVDSVRVVGEVKDPGSYSFARGMTAEDLIIAAGGFTREAQGYEVEVSRLRLGLERSDTVSQRFELSTEGTIPWEVGGRIARTELPGESDLPPASRFELQKGDQVFVRRLPGFVEPGAVRVVGEVLFPGPYAFTLREERLSSFVRRAGGVTEDAYLQGARLVRDSIPVGIELQRALRTPGTSADPILQPGDQLIIPVYDGTVVVEGAVAFDSRVIFREGEDLGYYLSQAGGTLEEADESRINVSYQNGERATTRKTLWIRRYPEIRPGSTIHVPLEVEGSGTDWGSVITTSLSVLSTTATLILAIGRLN